MIKKILCGVLATAMVASLLVGCGAKSGGGDTKKSDSKSDKIVVGFAQVGAESDWRTANTGSIYRDITSVDTARSDKYTNT